jgi:hypothetical protein
MQGLRLTKGHADTGILSEESLRDQLSAAEELVYVGHKDPAVVAAGAALEGALRYRASRIAGLTASAGALLEALLAMRAIDDAEYEAALDILAARDRLVHGYTPEHAHATEPERVWLILQVVVRLLESPTTRSIAARTTASSS